LLKSLQKKTAAVVEEEGWDDVELGAKLELKVPKLKDTSPRDSSASDWEDDLPDFPSKLPGSTPIKKLTSKEGLATQKKSASSKEDKKSSESDENKKEKVKKTKSKESTDDNIITPTKQEKKNQLLHQYRKKHSPKKKLNRKKKNGMKWNLELQSKNKKKFLLQN